MKQKLAMIGVDAAFFEARSGGPFHPGLEDGIRVARVLDLALQGASS